MQDSKTLLASESVVPDGEADAGIEEEQGVPQAPQESTPEQHESLPSEPEHRNSDETEMVPAKELQDLLHVNSEPDCLIRIDDISIWFDTCGTLYSHI
jgi:hypothetical protein